TFKSSVFDHLSYASGWVAPIPVAITQASNPGWPLCVRSGFAHVSFGDANGVIHRVDCRDNRVGADFSGQEPLKGWHEFHHAAYGEADEYCCDGGYRSDINLYSSLQVCRDKSSDAATCAQVTKVDSDGTAKSVAWWRSDTGDDDVMIGNL